MALTTRLTLAIARQLAEPSGRIGRVVGRALNLANRRLVLAAVEVAAIRDGSTVADVGFGGGASLALMLTRVGESGVVHGVDVSNTMLEAADRRFRRHRMSGRLQLHKASISRLPLPDGSLDVLVSTNTIHFVADDIDGVLAELGRVLSPAGRLVLGVDDPDAMARKPLAQHGFTLRQISLIVDHLRIAGFTDVQHRRVDGQDSPHVIVGVKP